MYPDLFNAQVRGQRALMVDDMDGSRRSSCPT